MLDTEMHHSKKNNSYVIAIATLFILAIMTASSMAAPASATTTPPASSSGIEFSPQPIYQGHARTVSETPINQTYVSSTNSGNGTLTLPETGETINVTSNGRAIFSRVAQSGQGEVTITTEEDNGGEKESATARYYEIVQFNFATGEGRGLMTAIFHTNSTGILAPLNGMVVAGIDHFLPNVKDNPVTLWEWESGIPLPTGTTGTMEEPPLMNTTRTNATTADTNAAATAAPEEEEGEGNEEEGGENPNEFEDCVVPPGRDPGDVGC